MMGDSALVSHKEHELRFNYTVVVRADGGDDLYCRMVGDQDEKDTPIGVLIHRFLMAAQESTPIEVQTATLLLPINGVAWLCVGLGDAHLRKIGDTVEGVAVGTRQGEPQISVDFCSDGKQQAELVFAFTFSHPKKRWPQPISCCAYLEPVVLSDRETIVLLSKQTILPIVFFRVGDDTPIGDMPRWDLHWPERYRETIPQFLAHADSITGGQQRDGGKTPPKPRMERRQTDRIPNLPSFPGDNSGNDYRRFGWQSQRGDRIDLLLPPHMQPTNLAPAPFAGGAVIQLASWDWHDRHLLQELAGGPWQGIHARICYAHDKDAHAGSVSFIWQKQGSAGPLAGLRRIAEVEVAGKNLIPFDLMGILYAIAQAIRAGIPAKQWPGLAATFVTVGAGGDSLSDEGEPIPLLSGSEVAERSQQWNGDPTRLPRHPYDRARVLWQVARLLWDNSTRITPLEVLGSWRLGCLVDAFALAQPLPMEIPVGQRKLRILSRGTYTAVQSWMLRQVACRGNLPAPALDYLVPGGILTDPISIVRTTIDPDAQLNRPSPAKVVPDADLLPPWIAELKRQALEQEAYLPVGPALVPLPPGTIFDTLWAIREARLFLDPEGMWAAFVDRRGSVCVLVRWSPAEERDWHFLMVPDFAKDAIRLCLAAIWLDMRRAGPLVFPLAGAAAPAQQGEKSKKRRRRNRKSPLASRPVHILPRPRLYQGQQLVLGGEKRDWGTPEQKEQVRRRGGHVRGGYWIVLRSEEAIIAALQAATGGQDGKIAEWEERRTLALGKGLATHYWWWDAIIDAATRIGDIVRSRARGRRGYSEVEGIELVRRCLSNLRSRCTGRGTTRLAQTLATVDQALGGAIEEGITNVLAVYAEQLHEKIAVVAQRARSWNFAPPPAGRTFHRPYTRRGCGDSAGAVNDTTPAPMVVARGLLALTGLLSPAEAETEAPLAEAIE